MECRQLHTCVRRLRCNYTQTYCIVIGPLNTARPYPRRNRNIQIRLDKIKLEPRLAPSFCISHPTKSEIHEIIIHPPEEGKILLYADIQNPTFW